MHHDGLQHFEPKFFSDPLIRGILLTLDHPLDLVLLAPFSVFHKTCCVLLSCFIFGSVLSPRQTPIQYSDHLIVIYIPLAVQVPRLPSVSHNDEVTAMRRARSDDFGMVEYTR